MEPVLFGLLLAAGAAGLTWWATHSGRSTAATGNDAIAEAGSALHALERDSTVVLDLEPDDVDDERVQRLVRAAAVQVLEQEARVEVVTVKNRAGVVLGRVPRNAPPMRHVPEVNVPTGEAHRSHTPTPVPHETTTRPPLDPSGIPAEPAHKDLADTFDLPESVRALVTDPRDPGDLLAATLRAAGHEVEHHDDVLRTGDVVFVVVDSHGKAVLGDALSRAFLHFEQTKAPRGYVVVMGFVPRAELAKREALAPQLTYVSRDAIQRMADAVAVGADPLSFVGPPQAEVIPT